MHQVGQIYMVSKGSLKPKNARFNNTSHEFEIYLERSSVVQHCPEDAETALIPAVQYNVSGAWHPTVLLASQHKLV